MYKYNVALQLVIESIALSLNSFGFYTRWLVFSTAWDMFRPFIISLPYHSNILFTIVKSAMVFRSELQPINIYVPRYVKFLMPLTRGNYCLKLQDWGLVFCFIVWCCHLFCFSVWVTEYSSYKRGDYSGRYFEKLPSKFCSSGASPSMQGIIDWRTHR